jgi:ribonuclease-3
MPPARRRQLIALLQRLGLDSPASLAPIDEALTHTSAGLACHHERLEFLGDAVLRLAAAEFLEREHHQLGVGRRSALRAQLVSDRWLAELAETCDLEPTLRIGAIASGDRAGRATLRAECAEALVGGLYEAWGGGSAGLAAVHTWLTPHWRRAASELLADPHRHNWKTALQEWSQGQGLGLPGYGCEERSRSHGDPRRFHCQVVAGPLAGEGWGGSRREAEQQAARAALEQLRPPAGC